MTKKEGKKKPYTYIIVLKMNSYRRIDRWNVHKEIIETVVFYERIQ